jgi:membrane associated rhomboid family serine protease
MSYRFNPQRSSGGFGGLGDGGPPPRDLVVLLAVLFVTFSLQFFDSTRALVNLFSLDLRVLRGFLWQLVTYPFVATASSGLWFLLELLILYWFGRSLLPRLGPRRFWRVLMIAAVGASVAAVVVEWLVLAVAPSWQHVPFLAMLGQRMVLTIVIAAFATLYGEATILLFFVLPLKARWFLWLEILFVFVFYFLPYKDLAGLVGTCVAVFLVYSSLTPGGPRWVLHRWRRRLEERVLRARLDRMRRKRRFDVIDGSRKDDETIH